MTAALLLLLHQLCSLDAKCASSLQLTYYIHQQFWSVKRWMSLPVYVMPIQLSASV
jgi:hypothetical protein